MFSPCLDEFEPFDGSDVSANDDVDLRKGDPPNVEPLDDLRLPNVNRPAPPHHLIY